jgi:two-component system response regulator
MKTSTILLVEDNADDAELAMRAFERTSVKNAIVLARDGAEALDYLFATGRYAESPAEPPDVVLLDLKLPRIDGIEVLRRVREDQRTRRLPIVVMTSSREAADVSRCYELGANSYVRKPVDFSEFVQAIHQVGAYWLQLNQPAPPT